MKTTAKFIFALALFCSQLTEVRAGTWATWSAKTTLAGTEEIWINDGGTDKKATLANALKGQAIVSPVITTGLTASGSAANTFGASTGTFITSTGANTLSGSVTVSAAATPSITLASGKTNSGYFLANGKTSGGIKILPADASAFTITITNDAQTSSGVTLTIPDFAGVNDVPVYATLAQTLAGKTLTAPKFADLGFLADPNGNEMLILDSVSSAVNELTIGNAATGNGPFLKATGETNVPLSFDSKGTGALLLNGTATGPVNVGDNTNPAFSVVHTTEGTGVRVTSAAAASGVAIAVTSSGTNENATLNAKGSGTITVNGTATGATIVPKLRARDEVTNYTADGAITLTSGVHTIAKVTAAAMTVAAPSSIDGTRMVIISNTDVAHVITFTGATLLDGTTGANTTVTMTAFKGSAITVIAVGTKWLLESSSNVTSIVP